MTKPSNARDPVLALRDEVRTYRTWAIVLYVVFQVGALIFACSALDIRRPGPIVLLLVCFVATQALFVFGGGRVRVGSAPSRKRLIAACVLFTGLMAHLSYLAAQVFGDVSNNYAHATPLAVSMTATWIVWLGVAVVRFRAPRTQIGFLGKLLAAVFFFSWVEFVTALFVYWTRCRVRPTSCACDVRSLVALIFCTPVLLWSVGPALVLLWFAEDRATEQGTLGLLSRIRERVTLRDGASS